MLEPDVRSEFLAIHPKAKHFFADRADTPMGDVFIDVYALTLASLLNNANEERIATLMFEACRVIDDCLQLLPNTVLFKNPNGNKTEKITCKEGCTHCCFMRVTTTPIEAIAIAANLRKQGAITQTLLNEIESYDAATSALDAENRLINILACPFLADNRCSIYAVRPKVCRTWHSFDVQRCIADKNDPRAMIGVPQDDMRKMIGNVVFDAMKEACGELNLDFPMLEFIPAVKVAIANDDTATRWLSGEQVFESCYRPDIIALSQANSEELVNRNKH